MESKSLGSSSVRISELGFGGGPLGGLFEPVDDETAATALAQAWDSGIRYFDTAPHYGIGHSERRFGEFLRHQPRSAFTLSTKVGRLLLAQDPEGRTDEAFQVPATHRRVVDFSRDGIRRSLEDSLSRMGVDRVDVLYLHDAEPHFEAALGQGYPAVAELRAEGVVGAIGAGMGDATLLTRLVEETDVDVVMVAGRYTLLDQSALDDLLPACQTAAFRWSPRRSSTPVCWPNRDRRPERCSNTKPRRRIVERANRIADVCAVHGVTLPQAAMAFPLRHPAVAGIVVGMRSAAGGPRERRPLHRRGAGPAVERPARRRPCRRPDAGLRVVMTDPANFGYLMVHFVEDPRTPQREDLLLPQPRRGPDPLVPAQRRTTDPRVPDRHDRSA